MASFVAIPALGRSRGHAWGWGGDGHRCHMRPEVGQAASEVVGTETNHNAVCSHEYDKQCQQERVGPRYTGQLILFVRVW